VRTDQTPRFCEIGTCPCPAPVAAQLVRQHIDIGVGMQSEGEGEMGNGIGKDIVGGCNRKSTRKSKHLCEGDVLADLAAVHAQEAEALELRCVICFGFRV